MPAKVSNEVNVPASLVTGYQVLMHQEYVDSLGRCPIYVVCSYLTNKTYYMKYLEIDEICMYVNIF